MIDAFIRWSFKLLIQMVFWVFLLSVSWEHRTLFDRAREVLVDNQYVAYADEQLVEWWHRLSEWGRFTLRREDQQQEDKAL